MQRKSLAGILIAAIPVVCGVLGAGVLVVAQQNGSAAPDAQFRLCSKRTLAGNYGSSSEGVLLPAPGLSLEFRGLTITRFDGRGNLTWIEHTVINGEPVHPGWTSASGTYTVAADCTGTMVINTPNSPAPLNLVFVVVKGGRELRAVLEAHAILSVFTKVD